MVLFMPMSFDLENLLSRVALIERAETFEVVKQQLRGFCAPLGYDHFVVFSASSARDDLIERLYWIEGDWFSDGRDVDAEEVSDRQNRQHAHDADAAGPGPAHAATVLDIAAAPPATPFHANPRLITLLPPDWRELPAAATAAQG